MNLLTLAGFVVMGAHSDPEPHKTGKLLSVGLMTAGTALVFGGLLQPAGPTECYRTREVANLADSQ
jgi:hypothetical protein